MDVALYYLALAAVIALAATKGGRYERSMALTLAAASLCAMAAQHVTRRFLPIVPFSIIDVLVLLQFVRVLAAYRRSWTYTLACLEVVQLVLDGSCLLGTSITVSAYLNASNLLSYAMFATLAYGVVRRRIGPPIALPREARGRVLAQIRHIILPHWL